MGSAFHENSVSGFVTFLGALWLILAIGCAGSQGPEDTAEPEADGGGGTRTASDSGGQEESGGGTDSTPTDRCSECISSSDCETNFCNWVASNDLADIVGEPARHLGRCSELGDQGTCACSIGYISGDQVCVGTGCEGTPMDLCDHLSGNEFSAVACTTVSDAAACTNGSELETNLGQLSDSACHDQCEEALTRGGVIAGCWILDGGICYCRSGTLNPTFGGSCTSDPDGMITCTTEPVASACTDGSVPEINLGQLGDGECHDQCEQALTQAGVTEGCWIRIEEVAGIPNPLAGNCYCRSGRLSERSSSSGGVCARAQSASQDGGGTLACTAESSAMTCMDGPVPEINLGGLDSAACHDRCEVELGQAGIVAGCWIMALDGNCYCRSGSLELGGAAPGGSCSRG